MIFKINGTDITSMLSDKEGLVWKEIDIHSDDSGRDMGTNMHVKVIGTKVNLSVKCHPLSQEKASQLLTLVKEAPPLVVEYGDPVAGVKTINCFSGDRNCEFLMTCQGVDWWQNVRFDLTEM